MSHRSEPLTSCSPAREPNGAYQGVAADAGHSLRRFLSRLARRGCTLLFTHGNTMNSTDQIKMLLSSFAMQLPVLLVCLVAGVVILARGKQGARGAVWALLGFGLALVLCILIPVVQTSVQSWVMQSGDIAHRASVFTVLSILWSVLRAISYALLLLAVIAQR